MSDLDVREKRNAARAENRMHATIHQPGNHRPMPCIVEDYSKTGAKISAEKINRIPDTFNLHFNGTEIFVDSIVVWRSRGSVGVIFEEAPLLR